jgi:hypothetical protein
VHSDQLLVVLCSNPKIVINQTVDWINHANSRDKNIPYPAYSSLKSTQNNARPRSNILRRLQEVNFVNQHYDAIKIRLDGEDK